MLCAAGCWGLVVSASPRVLLTCLPFHLLTCHHLLTCSHLLTCPHALTCFRSHNDDDTAHAWWPGPHTRFQAPPANPSYPSSSLGIVCIFGRVCCWDFMKRKLLMVLQPKTRSTLTIHLVVFGLRITCKLDRNNNCGNLSGMNAKREINYKVSTKKAELDRLI